MTLTRKAFLKMLGAGGPSAHLPAGRGLGSSRKETARADAKRPKSQHRRND